MTIIDRLLVESTIYRVDLQLGGRASSATRRDVRRDLRAHLVEAAREEGARTAIRDLVVHPENS